MNREEVIEFIKRNDSRYKSTDFSRYSDTQLIIIKVRIELEINERENGFEE